MKLSARQQHLHWALWKKAEAILYPQSGIRNPQSDSEARHALYIEALGEDKSLTAMDNADFDLVLGKLMSIIEPGNLNAQLHAVKGERVRLLHGIEAAARKLGVSDAYVQGIIDRMDARRGDPSHESDRSHPPLDSWERERERGERPQRRLQELHPRELVKVLIALRQHQRRSPVAASLCEAPGASVAQTLMTASKQRCRHHALAGGPMRDPAPF
jgi:hypothetical protein